MAASEEGQVECVKMLLDRGAEVNMQKKVSGVIIDCVHAMQTYPEVPVVNGDLCTGTLFRPCLSCYLLSATNNKRTLQNAHMLYNP